MKRVDKPRTDSARWIYPVENPALQSQIMGDFHLSPILGQFFISRGIVDHQEIHDFLYATLPDLFDPQLFAEMDRAVCRIEEALQRQEAILVYGDNDVDGMTGTALLTDFLRQLGATVHFYVPNRTSLKQSVLLDALQYAIHNQCRLMITVDCGITAAKEIEEIVANHVDVIVTDHHEPTNAIPHCIATLNPKLVGSPYPNRELTGVGVAFKLVHAITNHLSAVDPDHYKIDLQGYLDLVALGTIADMGALQSENRILVRYGLRQLRRTPRVGLIRLVSVCGLELSELSAGDIASKIAPRLNSLGRVAEPRKGVELLLIRDSNEAQQLAKELDLYNTARQKIEQQVSESVEDYIRDHPEILKEKAIIIHSDQWHSGVIPIVTARIAKQYNRPTIMIAVDKQLGKGSARTIREFPLLPALKEHAQLLINFGGHDFAAGLTIHNSRISEFKQRFLEIANRSLKDEDLTTKINIDAKVDFCELTFDFMESLALLEPYGNDNAPPIFYCDARQVWPARQVGKSHLKLYLEQNDRLLEGIAFGMADRVEELKKRNLWLRILFTPVINKFQNKLSIQLVLRDFRLLNEPAAVRAAARSDERKG